jgi:phosphatidylinositol dimannoside acyltransferase
MDRSFSLQMASFISRILPRRFGYAVADFVARQIAARRDTSLIRAVRANQWVIRGEHLDTTALDQVVFETMRQSARSIYNLYHSIHNPEATRNQIVLDGITQELARRSEFEERGLMVVGVHLSNFDLVLQWLCRQGMRPLILTIPDPQGGRRMEFEMRKNTGANIVPASVATLRQALKHLQKGGFVVTGIDRPIPQPGVRPIFFGRPAALPVHHTYLATRAEVPVLIVAAHSRADGKYHVTATGPIEMDTYPDRDQEALRNAEKVLSIAEQYIRQAPEQWSVSLPVWPEIMDLVP